MCVKFMNIKEKEDNLECHRNNNFLMCLIQFRDACTDLIDHVPHKYQVLKLSLPP